MGLVKFVDSCEVFTATRYVPTRGPLRFIKYLQWVIEIKNNF